MWRAGGKTVLHIQTIQARPGHPICRKRLSNRPEPRKRLCGMVELSLAGGTALILGLGYTFFRAKRNPDFRDKVEQKIPGSKTAFKFILGAPIIKPFDPLEKPFTSNKEEYSAPQSTKDLPSEKDESTCDQPLQKNQLKPCIDKEISSDTVTELIPFKPSKQFTNKENVAGDNDGLNKTLDNLCLADLNKSKTVLTVTTKGGEKTIADKSNPNTNASFNHNRSSSPMLVENNFHENPSTSSDDDENNFEDNPTNENNGNVTIKEVANEGLIKYDESLIALDDLLSECSEASSNAILLNNAAANALALHSSLLRTAIDDTTATAEEKSFQWSDVNHAFIDKEKKIKDAFRGHEKAVEEMSKLKNALENIDVENNHLIKHKVFEVDQTFNNIFRDLEDAKNKVTEELNIAVTLEKYKTSLEEAKTDIQKNFNLPDGMSMESWQRQGKLTKDYESLQALRSMHLKVEELKEELVKEKDSSAQNLDKTINEIKTQTERELREAADTEKNKIIEESRISRVNELNQIKTKFEAEIKEQLRKQSSAHAEHLAQALAFMDKQAADKYEHALHEEIEHQWEIFEKKYEEQRLSFSEKISIMQEQYQQDLNIALARIEGINKAMAGRAFVESETRKAQELALACDSLLISIRYGDEGKPLPLASQIDTIRNVYGEHRAIDIISSALPEEAQTRGVYPEEAIRLGFSDVAKTCRRVSMVDDERNSLFTYFLSYLKSFLTISNASLEPPEQIDVADLDVFKILSYANHCLQRGNMEQAVRFLNQLSGESKKVAENWLKEARLYLETKQSVDALCALSNSIVIGAQLE